jgi:hypothetical protein
MNKMASKKIHSISEMQAEQAKIIEILCKYTDFVSQKATSETCKELELHHEIDYHEKTDSYFAWYSNERVKFETIEDLTFFGFENKLSEKLITQLFK